MNPRLRKPRAPVGLQGLPNARASGLRPVYAEDMSLLLRRTYRVRVRRGKARTLS
jgi:hypothetical protein